jgi:hypothetical protein
VRAHVVRRRRVALGVLVGAEVRYNAVLGGTSDSISLLATLGVHTD